jgi:hypothetical protein
VLTQPFINNITAFDSDIGTIIIMGILGGNTITGYTYTITNNQDSLDTFTKTVYVSSDDGTVGFDEVRSFDIALNQDTTLGFLENNKEYKMVINTFNDTETSINSRGVLFNCYKMPSFTFNAIVEGVYRSLIDNDILDSQEKRITLTFNTNDVDSIATLNTCNIKLYGVSLDNSDLIFASDNIYIEPLEILVKGFLKTNDGNNNYNSYTLIANGITVEGLSFSTTISGITIEYALLTHSPYLRLTNRADKGFIIIESLLTAIKGSSNPNPPIYLTSTEVDLSDDDSWVKWDNEFIIPNVFTGSFWGRNFNDNEDIISLKTDSLYETIITYIDDGTETYLTLNSYNGTFYPYYIESNRLDSTLINASTDLFIGIQREYDLWNIYIAIIV